VQREKWTSSIAKLAYAVAFVGFAIVLGNCVGINTLLICRGFG